MDTEKAFGWTMLVLGVCAVAFGCYASFESVRSNGETDYCYVEMLSPTEMAPQWLLIAHRPWRTDRHLGVYSSLDEATTKANDMHCKLNYK